MSPRLATLGAAALALTAAILVACGGHGSGGMAPAAPMYTTTIDRDLALVAKLPKNTVGEELPSEGLGSVHSLKWKAVLGGYTQEHYSQSLAFPPGTTIEIRNLTKNNTPCSFSPCNMHTFNVIKVVTKPPANFPTDPSLTLSARGGGKLSADYASGVIESGKSVKIKLDKPGIYLIGCAFHYSEGMRDVLVVAKGAKPGPQATAPKADPTSKPSSGPTSTPAPW